MNARTSSLTGFIARFAIVIGTILTIGFAIVPVDRIR